MKNKTVRMVNPDNFSNPETLLPLILNRIGYSPETISKPIHEKIKELITMGLKTIHIDYVEQTTQITSWGKSSITGKGIRIDSYKWSNLLHYLEVPELLNCFVVTLGKQLDQLIEEKRKDSLFDAYVLDALGSLMAEKAADQMETSISNRLSFENYEWSHRFSPGYCDWNLVTGQAAIFQFLHPETIEVTSMTSGMIIPEKSVSAVIIGAKKITTKSPCLFCKDQHCKYRRTN
ncbi:MAG: hypothetical protein APR62_08115 [Smithella sp. SDB]|nr:MAG: hypothetical protein APR62_08115 [Smithella sp. SDB]